MDYKIGFYFVGFIVIIILKLCHSQSERDVILTPKLALHVNGKTLYYKPTTILINQTNNIPWEQTLKHLTFLTLSNDLNETSGVEKFPNYERFMNSSYVQNNIYIPKFGDIITLAKGRLETNDKNEFQFIEGDCENQENCNVNKIIASWQVQKIRHRDADKKFRYEIKFTVTPKGTTLNSEKIDSGKRDINNHRRSLRSFVLKDTDYPKSFEKVEEHIAQRRHDENRQIYLEKLNSFNDIFSQPRFFNQDFNENRNLNIGEYMPETSTLKGQSRVGGIFPFLFQSPTTYRPHRYKFDKPYNFLENEQNNFKQSYSAPIIPTRYHHVPANYDRNVKRPSEVTTHLHHHYYAKNNQLQDHRGALDLIEQPLTSIKPIRENIEHFNFRTPNPISNQIPIPQYFPKFQEPISFHHQPNTQSTIHQQQTPPEPYYSIHKEKPQILNYQHNTPSIIHHQQTPSEPYYNVHKENHQILNYQPKFESPPVKYEIPTQTRGQSLNNLSPNPLSHTSIYYQQNTPRPLTPSGPQLFYMQPIPISSQLPVFFYGNPNDQKTPEPRNKNHYSEPDPLYNANENETDQYSGSYQQDEIPNSENSNNDELQDDEPFVNNKALENNEELQNNESDSTEDIDNYKPDSINAQLPPPDEGQDLQIPYVESVVTENLSIDETSKAASSTRFTQESQKVLQKLEKTKIPEKPVRSTTPTPIPDSSSKRYTSAPIPETSSKKFIPNLKKIRKFKPATKGTIERTTKNSISDLPKVITTPTAATTSVTLATLATVSTNLVTTPKLVRSTTERPVLKWKPRTTKLQRIPTKPPLKALTQIEFERIPVTEPDKIFTVTPSKLDSTIPTRQSVATSISYKIGKNGIERPVVIPNLDIMEAKLIKLPTQDKSIKLFKATPMEEENETENSEKIERELQDSIVEHVKRIRMR